MTTFSPAIILIDPQMGENIGMVARAMLNCGLTDLRLVRPRDGWPSEQADCSACGALEKGVVARVFETTEEAIADCHFVVATTARPRDMVKDVYTGRSAAEKIRGLEAQEQQCAILFGPERSGLVNDDIALAHGVVTIPLNPDFTSLNLAQAVLLVSYEWRQAADQTPEVDRHFGDTCPATMDERVQLYQRLFDDLERGGFFTSAERRPTTQRNLTTMLNRMDMTEQEVRTFHGIISALNGKKGSH